MTNTNIITTIEFAQYAPEIDTSRYTDTTVSGFIGMASEQVNQYLGYSPLAEDIVNERRNSKITSEGDLLVFPTKVPIITVSSLSIVKGAVTISLPLTDGNSLPRYTIDFTGRNLRLVGGYAIFTGYPMVTNFYALKGQQFYTSMDYRAGYEIGQIPSSIKLATSLFVRDIIARSYNTTGATMIRQGGITISYSDNKEGESDLVRDAKHLLNPYRRIA